MSHSAPGPVLGENVKVGENVTFGAYVVVHDGTTIGDGCVIEDHVVLGKRPRLARSSSAKGDVGDLVLGERVTVCSGAVVFAGAPKSAMEAIVGRSVVRARALSDRPRVGDRKRQRGRQRRNGGRAREGPDERLSDRLHRRRGRRFRGAWSDDHQRQHDERATAPRRLCARRSCCVACRVGGNAVLTPGVEIGEEAFVAAGAVVTKDVPARGVAIGVPARVVREVGEPDLLERWR